MKLFYLAFTLVVLMTLENFFFWKDGISIQRLFQSTSNQTLYLNFTIIARSTFLILTCLFLFFGIFSIITKKWIKDRTKYFWLFVYSTYLLANIVIYFIYHTKEIQNVFYLSFNLLILFFINLIYAIHMFVIQKKINPLDKNVIWPLYLTYIFRFLWLVVFYVLFAIIAFGSASIKDSFYENFLIKFFNELLIGAREFKNAFIIFLFLLLIVFGLISSSFEYWFNIHVTKNKIKSNEIFYWMSSIFFLGAFAFFVKQAAGEFIPWDSTFGIETNYLSLYIFIAINIIVLTTIITLKFLAKRNFKIRKFFKNKYLIYWILLLIWIANLINSLFNVNTSENFKIIAVNFASSIIVYFLLFIWQKEKTTLRQLNVLSIIFITISLMSIVIGFNNYLLVNKNYLSINIYSLPLYLQLGIVVLIAITFSCLLLIVLENQKIIKFYFKKLLFKNKGAAKGGQNV
ncbi:hypothetical protein NV226_02960 [Mycoplasma iguanae]|uniref:Transmembrane protein n=1 Tax=Mycoplasma iguanae TaxID=292461 RepID=A0ABY5R881_9MOLU|nr:hypothetical protein [Mycoplasma iguanae]UVD81659.1 hypothetical protein NV226_02960 [Mycoplasma iguanae]